MRPRKVLHARINLNLPKYMDLDIAFVYFASVIKNVYITLIQVGIYTRTFLPIRRRWFRRSFPLRSGKAPWRKRVDASKNISRRIFRF